MLAYTRSHSILVLRPQIEGIFSLGELFLGCWSKSRIYFLINYFRFLKKKGKKAGDVGDRKRFRVDEFWEKIGLIET